LIKLSSSSADIENAAGILKSGKLVAFPTETVYGLGADAFNTLALARVFEVKGRPRFDPLIIHIASLDFLERIACLDGIDSQRREQLYLLIDSFWPGPLTLILPKRKEVPDLATAGLPTAAIRFPSHPIARALITLSTGAIAAPSANPFGRLSPSKAEHVIETLGDSIDCIIDGGPCPVGVESTVLELLPVPLIRRPGGISREQLETLIGPIQEDSKDSADLNCDHIKTGRFAAPSPGMLQSHYAPHIPLFLHSPEEMAVLPYHKKEGYLFFSAQNREPWKCRTSAGQVPDKCKAQTILTLSEEGNTTEAAAHLFEYLHILDKTGVSCIHAEVLPEEGIGAAVNDRLRRAAANH